MVDVSGFRVLHSIHESSRTFVFRALREPDGLPVVVKLLRKEYPTAEELARFRREQEVTRMLSLDGVIRVHDLVPYGNSLAMVLEDFGAVSLDLGWSMKRAGLAKFLEVAVDISKAIDQVHRNHVIHKDINPSNIVWNEQSGQVKLIDFGLSTQLAREHLEVVHPSSLEGTLAYMAPEQTGRVNRVLDSRADLYSLGATFFEMLTGQRLFSATDPMELVHCHIAKMPSSPHAFDDSIAEILSRIVMKLLSKNAEERYQSAFGVQSDLERCLTQFRATGELADFDIGTDDFSGQFRLPQKLFGRGAELERLLAAFQRTSAGGKELLLVSGDPGIGKSVLVQEVHRPVVETNGIFIRGICEKLCQETPYVALIQAFKELTGFLLAETEERLATWRTQLREALGINARIIIDVIPELAHLLGEHPPVVELPSTEAQTRFIRTFETFIRVFADAEHPLVVFLDDLQWADPSTLRLMERFVCDPEAHHILFVGAYRDNEVGADHPLLRLLTRLGEAGVAIEQISLSPLAAPSITELVAETLACEGAAVESLAKVCAEKTRGNPFFLGQMLLRLHDEGLLEHDSNRSRWSYDLDAITRLRISDEIAELMAAKLAKLPAETQRVLGVASCIGKSFGLTMLAAVCGLTPAETAQALSAALREALVVPNDASYRFVQESEQSCYATYRFLHDRVREAAGSLLAPQEERSTHALIGRQLLSEEDGSQEELALTVARHLNWARSLITTDAERRELALLNLRAGILAKKAIAFDEARGLLTVGLQLLPTPASEGDHTSWYELTIHLAECEYLCGNQPRSQELFGEVLERGRPGVEKARAHATLVLLHTSVGDLPGALAAALEGLTELGITLPDSTEAQEGAVGAEIGVITGLIGDRQIEDLVDLPKLEEPSLVLALEVMMNVIPAAYMLGKFALNSLLAAKMVSLSLQHGNAAPSSHGYMQYALVLSAGLGDYESAHRFGKLGLALTDPRSALAAKNHFMWPGFIGVWTEDFKVSVRHFHIALEKAMQLGDDIFGGYALHNGTFSSLLTAGVGIEELQRHCEGLEPFAGRINNELARAAFRFDHQALKALRGETAAPTSLSDAHFDADALVDKLRETQSAATLLGNQRLLVLLILLVHGDYEAMGAIVDELGEYEAAMAGSDAMIWCVFLSALAHLGRMPALSTEEGGEARESAVDSLRKLESWAERCPVNIECMRALVDAELARVDGKLVDDVARRYDTAVRRATDTGRLHIAALANEAASRFFAAQNLSFLGFAYLRQAHYIYDRWGASAKVHALEESHPELALRQGSGSLGSATDGRFSTSSGHGQQLDLSTVLKASLAISREIEPERMLGNMMKVLAENAGAQQGALLIDRYGEFRVEATVSEDSIAFGANAAATARIAETIVHYVLRTGEAVVLDDATSDPRFASDPHLVQGHPKSVLCAPIRHLGRTVAAVYLENNAVAGAFNAERLELLQILSAQAAISLENSRLFANLEAVVRERTRDLEEAQEKILWLRREATEVQMAGGFAHEVRNALTGARKLLDRALGAGDGRSLCAESSELLGEAFLLVEGGLDSGQRAEVARVIGAINDNDEVVQEVLTRVSERTDRALGITDQLTEYSRIGQARRGTHAISLADVICSCLPPDFKEELDEQGIEVVVELGSVSPLVGSASHFHSVLSNLLLNARDAVLEEGARERRIEIALSEDERVQWLVVDDRGVGISAEDRPRVFEPFFTTKPNTGTGLGLGVASKLVKLYGGTVSLESELGRGTRAIVAFPLPTEVG